MVFFDILKNSMNSILGRKQEFEELLAARDIDGVRSQMTSRSAQAIAALQEYNTQTHRVMFREDKILTDKAGKMRSKVSVAKLPIPYQQYINEIALVFLYGRPVKWSQLSDNTDAVFDEFQDVLKRTRFDSKIRECKRIAGIETESAMLFRVFKDEETGKPDVQIRVLAHSKGDEIFTRFDQYENLISVAWGYKVKEADNKIVEHFDIFMPDVIYRCTHGRFGWDVELEQNFIGKIPIILFQQEKEWHGVEALIEREEMIASRTADTNDYFADPVAVFDADAIKNLPEKDAIGKSLFVRSGQKTTDAMHYVTWDSAPQSKKDEIEWLQNQILTNSFTPHITLDTLKSLSTLSAKALRTVMMLADIKAAKRKEKHDELLDRTASLVLAIIGNVLNVSLHSQCEEASIGHEFQEPFGEDVADDLNDIIRAVDAGILSTETAIELNPLVKDVIRETERLKAEQEERLKQQQSIFGDPDGAGAQSYTDGNDYDTDDDDDDKNDTDEEDKKKKSEKK
ncbi:MAG: phage portal protein [Lachnospiraceae bacterium]|nr:phage portal protein [Lachnospiraceae bacterium]